MTQLKNLNLESYLASNEYTVCHFPNYNSKLFKSYREKIVFKWLENIFGPILIWTFWLVFIRGFRHQKEATFYFRISLYLSPTNPTLNTLIKYLWFKVDRIQQTFPNAEVIILGDFTVDNSSWFKYSTYAGLENEAFATTHNLTKIVKEHTSIPENINHHWNILD